MHSENSGYEEVLFLKENDRIKIDPHQLEKILKTFQSKGEGYRGKEVKRFIEELKKSLKDDHSA